MPLYELSLWWWLSCIFVYAKDRVNLLTSINWLHTAGNTHDSCGLYDWRMLAIHRVPTLPGKPGILSFTFPGLENVWNLLKKWEIPGILTHNPKKIWKIEIFIFSVSRFTFQDVIYIWFTSLSYLHYQHKYWFKAKLSMDLIAFSWK